MDSEVRALIWQRANSTCEYCRMPKSDAGLVEFHVEHIYPRKHGGSDDPQNLCLSCADCNFAKGPNLSGLIEGKIVPLFHPRREIWSRHFQWDGAMLKGKTLCGKATICVLNINLPWRIRRRRALITSGRFLPED
jgi:5-methylcytosine-specific restriction endonuclease McrA